MPSRSWLSLANGAPPFNIFELLATFPLAVSHRIKVSLNRMFDRKKPPLGIEREAMAYDQYLVNPLSSSLYGAVGNTYTDQEIHTCDFHRPCGFPNSYGEQCGQPICCNTVSVHFRDLHGIVDMSRSVQVVCQWAGCGRTSTRHNIIRHLCEVHLCHRRQ